MASYSTKKCTSCGEWADGKQLNCPFCGEIMDEHDRRENIKQEAFEEEEARLKRIDAARTPFQRKMHRIFSTAQAIYMGITTFIAWVIAWLAG